MTAEKLVSTLKDALNQAVTQQANVNQLVEAAQIARDQLAKEPLCLDTVGQRLIRDILANALAPFETLACTRSSAASKGR